MDSSKIKQFFVIKLRPHFKWKQAKKKAKQLISLILEQIRYINVILKGNGDKPAHSECLCKQNQCFTSIMCAKCLGVGLSPQINAIRLSENNFPSLRSRFSDRILGCYVSAKKKLVKYTYQVLQTTADTVIMICY